MDSFFETPEGRLVQHRRRERRRILIYLDDVEPQSKKMVDADKDAFQRKVLKELKDLRRAAFVGPLALSVHLSTTRAMAPQAHTIAKNLLDLLGSRRPSVRGSRKHILYKDDSQVHGLTVSCAHGETQPRIAIEARPFATLLDDLELSAEALREIEQNDPGRRYRADREEDAISSFKRLVQNETENRRRLGDQLYEAMVKMERWYDRDTHMRIAAFEHVRRLGEVHDHLTATELKPGFIFDGERIPLINPQRGIFKPQQMRFLLSIKTVFPKPGGKVWYDDQREVHRQIFEGDETIDYAFMGQDPDAADNRWLREAFENRIPIIYFLGIAPGRYQAMLPIFISGWDGKALKARVAFGVPDQETLAPPETALERRYALRAVKQRLHQASFREAVIAAYNGRCALSGLPEPLLLDAAHIVVDGHEQLGQPVVPNGIPLSKIHHAAFDAHLIGIDPDYRLHVSERLLVQNDGPMLEALKRLNGGTIHLPNRMKDRPDRDRLALRFERFKAVA